MNNKIIGNALIILGFALMYWGYEAYNEAVAQVHNTAGGGAPLQTWIGVIMGMINVFVGYRKLK